jgi:hypothetical protein
MDWKDEPGPWRLNAQGVIDALGKKPLAIGVYFIGLRKTGRHKFRLRYCGKAVRQPLFERLNQHIKKSSNVYIREHLTSKKADKEEVWFRFKEFGSSQLAELAEGIVITALLSEFAAADESEDEGEDEAKVKFWNERNEWKQHWAAEDD